MSHFEVILAENIRGLLNTCPAWSHEMDSTVARLQICPCDNLDKTYSVKCKDGGIALWLNMVRDPLQFERISAPDKGVIEVTLTKRSPNWSNSEGSEDEFKREVTNYFNRVFRADAIFGHIAAFKMKTDYRQFDDYIRTTWTLYTDGSAYLDEDMKSFILRKLESIFEVKGARCNEIPDEDNENPHLLELFGPRFIYEFDISIS